MKNKSSERGFIQIILMVIIVLVVAALLGFNVSDLWNNYVVPLVQIIVEFFVLVFKLLIGIVNILLSAVQGK